MVINKNIITKKVCSATIELLRGLANTSPETLKKTDEEKYLVNIFIEPFAKVDVSNIKIMGVSNGLLMFVETILIYDEEGGYWHEAKPSEISYKALDKGYLKDWFIVDKTDTTRLLFHNLHEYMKNSL